MKRHGKTSYEQINGRKPDISYFHVFGYVCFILNQKDQLSVFQEKVEEAMFLGYPSISKALRVFNLKK